MLRKSGMMALPAVSVDVLAAAFTLPNS